MELTGLPLHPLVVHAAVVIVPALAAALAGFAVVPRWRWLLRWPTAALALVSVAVVFLARESGEALLADRPFLLEARETAELISTHQTLGTALLWSLVPVALLAVAGALTLAGPSPLTSGRGARGPATGRYLWAEKLLPALLVVGAVAVLVLVVLTGDAGTRAVWG